MVMEWRVGVVMGSLGLLLWFVVILRKRSWRAGWSWSSRYGVNNSKKNNNNKAAAAAVANLLPPGSLGWPLLGESLQFVASLSSALSPDSFAQQHLAKYGDVFKTHLFGHPTVVSLDPEVNKFVMNNEGRLFVASHPESFEELFGKYTILAARGDVHKRKRAVVVNFINSEKFRESIIPCVETFALLTLNNWKDRVVYVEREAQKFAFRVIMKKLLSLPVGPDLEDMLKEFSMVVAGSLSVRLKMIPWSNYSKGLKARDRIIKKLTGIIEGRRKDFDNDYNDLLQAVFREDRHGGATTSFSTEDIVDQILFLLAAGYDTVAAIITSTMFFLRRAPEALQTLREEHEAIKKGKINPAENLTWADYKSMTFTQHVINESLRITNVGFGAFRTALEDVKIKGYTIPKHWKVLAYLRSAHFNPSIYGPDPYAFDPWRWQDQSENMINGEASFMPFGEGKRRCVGSDLARLELSIFFHHLVTRFRNWELIEEDRLTYFPTPHFMKSLPVVLEAS
ncbi:hypothetical protein O6H91_20G039700 [Diphasiastrum complanatum]|uniref:Uncharacterized protein n=2 Tax=Diphasiastrum complanatum TaxID=34168 RepID=A0ACC2APN1_DIPCM|nr:hypothetical protein O6H91_20G039700 [Diphasiastrum complanatum]KAJ7519466.1 hypothetical protein O6H91_20G039700 [Diphasiastrum complanatum]